MSHFSNKKDKILLIISIVCLFFSALLIFVGSNYLTTIENFISSYILHRNFNIEKWTDTILSLITVPFIVIIFIDIVLFVKLSDKSKSILIISVGILGFILLCYSSFTKTDDFINSDMASEILLGKECFLQKTFWPRSWNYSTELRVLNTQLITAPLFLFTSDFYFIKGLSSIILCLFLPLSLYFLLNQLNIKKLWIKLLCCLFIFFPFSSEMWGFVHFGNYYIPHIVIAFIYTGLFFALTYKELSKRKKNYFFILYIILSLSSGLAGIRYILYFQFPLAVTIICLELNKLFKLKEPFNWRSFFINNKAVFYSVIGLLIGGIGYLLNSTLLSALFNFDEFNSITFNPLGENSIKDVLYATLKILGYKDNIAVFSPSGAVNVFIYISITMFILSFISHLKKDRDSVTGIFFIFFIVMFIFNSFVIINTDNVLRYFILQIVFAIPCFALIIESINITNVKKYITIASVSFTFISSIFITFSFVSGADYNKNEREVADFLSDSNFKFGYGTFWNANIFTFMTNGKIEIATLNQHQEPLEEKIEIFKWLTPERYYEDSYKKDGSVILIASNDEYDNFYNKKIFENGTIVFENSGYKIFEYPNNEKISKSLIY